MKERSFCNLCRRLANRERFEAFRQVVLALKREGLTVNEVAERVRLQQPATSQYLAQLERECGLVRSVRDGRYVNYRFACDETFEAAARLGPALGRQLRDEAAKKHFNPERGEAPPFLRVFEALGNETRAEVAALVRRAGRMSKGEIRRELGLSELNARRHAGMLCELGLVAADEGGYRWLEPADVLSRLFLDYHAATRQVEGGVEVKS